MKSTHLLLMPKIVRCELRVETRVCHHGKIMNCPVKLGDALSTSSKQSGSHLLNLTKKLIFPQAISGFLFTASEPNAMDMQLKGTRIKTVICIDPNCLQEKVDNIPLIGQNLDFWPQD